MILNISPYAFRGVDIKEGSPNPIPGFGLVPFAVLSTLFSVLAVYVLIRKLIRGPSSIEKQQFRFVLIGILGMLGLIIVTVFLPVTLFRINTFVSFIPLYTLIFLGMTAYAIIKHHLFNIKIIVTEALTVIIWIILFSKAVVSESAIGRIVDIMILVMTIAFGILLIKSVRREVEQREELARLNVKLEAANTELESLSRFKTQLLSLASHQVKSPLAAIKGFVTLVMDGTYGPVSEKIKEVMQKVKRSSDTLINLVNSLLDLRKVEEGKMEYQFAKVGLREMVNSVVENIRPLAQEKKLEFTFTSPKAEIFVNADGPKLQQVIQNLVDNAIKYTPAGFVRVEMKEDSSAGHSTLRVSDSMSSPQEGAVIVSVKDSGLGVSKKLLPHLFEEFVRDEKVKQEIRGTGLGLYIAKKIVEAHGGELWAESEGEGKGSRFYVKLRKV